MSMLDRPVRYRSMTPEQVLHVLIEIYQRALSYHEAEPNSEPHNSMTLKAWEDASGEDFDLSYPGMGIGGYFNAVFHTRFPRKEWRPLLRKKKTTTLREVCQLIAIRANVPDIQPLSVFGRKCASAGAFLTIRNLMAERGANISNLKPSSPLQEYAESGLPEIAGELFLAAPGLASCMNCQYPSDAGCMLLGGILLITSVSCGVASAVAPLIGVPLCMAAFAGFWFIYEYSKKRQSRPRRVQISGMESFRDLCERIGATAQPSASAPA